MEFDAQFSKLGQKYFFYFSIVSELLKRQFVILHNLETY